MSAPFIVKLSRSDFEQLRTVIYKVSGIHLSDAKKILVESRLQKRLSALDMTSFADYCDYIFGRKDTHEITQLIDAVATNKTDFFREPAHFDFLQNEVLPAFRPRQQERQFKVWSAACSSGEEPYTLAMVLEEWLGDNPPFEYRIVASDISTKVLDKAVKAVYEQRVADQIPIQLRRKYLMQSKDQVNPTVRIAPELRSRVMFKRINLTDVKHEVESDFDVIFCRNVLIYFDRQTQEMVVQKLVSKLRTGGYLFIGHSESIHHMKLPVRQVRPTIFQRS